MATNPYFDFSEATRFERFDTVRAEDANAAFDLVTAGFDAVSERIGTVESLGAGEALSFLYSFSTATADLDPGDGFLCLDNATQNAATTLRISTSEAGGSNILRTLDTMDDSTSTIKARVRLVAVDDPTKFLLLTVTAAAAPSVEYRNFTVSVADYSAASPFANNMQVMVTFAVTGDKGSAGTNGTNGVSNAMTYEARATGADVPLTFNDTGKLVDITSGTFTQTIALKSTFTSSSVTGTLLYANSGSGIVTFTPTAPDTIDGNTTRKVYPGEAFILAPASGGWTAILVRPMHLLDTAAGTWQPEPGYAGWWQEQSGSGSGGGSGASGSSGSGIAGGNGGGGGGGGGPGLSGQGARQWIDAARLASKITGGGRGTIAYAPGAGGAGGTSRTGASGATSGNSGSNGTDGALGSAGNATTFGTANDAYYLSTAGGSAMTGTLSGAVGKGSAGGANNGGAAPSTTGTTTVVQSASGPDIFGIVKAPTELPTIDATAGTGGSVPNGGAGGRGSTYPRGFNVGAGDITSGTTAAPGGVGAATVAAGKPATPATPTQAAPGCGGYGGGGGGGSAAVVGSNGATAAGGDSAPGGQGGAGFIRIRGVL